MQNRLRVFSFALLIFFLQINTAPAETRALWVTRWDYSSPENIDLIMRDAAELGFNTILFQVRGNGTVAYPSKIELQAEAFRTANWDPLQYAVDSAHKNGLELHAWINVYIGWSGAEPPENAAQLYRAQPSWFMYDVYDRPQPLRNGYLWLSPTNPQVRDYLQTLCREIFTGYDVDGLHFDYIRFPGLAYSYDPVSVRLFEKSYGAPPAERPVTWQQWRQNSIAEFLQAVYADAKRAKPRVILSAAVISDIDRARDIYFQDGCDWLARGCIDALYPMLYSTDNQVFYRELVEYLQNDHGRHIYPGINLVKNDVAVKLQIAKKLGARGLGIFSYSSLMANANFKNSLKLALDSLWREQAAPAVMPWKNNSQDNRGPMVSNIRALPSPLTPSTPFKLVAKITDAAGVYDDSTGKEGQGIYIEYGENWPLKTPKTITMSKIEATQNWYVSDSFLPGAPAGTVLRARITARDNFYVSRNRPQRNAGYSAVVEIPVVKPDSSFEYAGEIGPILWRPGAIAVDALGQIWLTTEKNGPVVVLDSTGREMEFSPIRTGLAADGQSMWLDNIVGLAADAAGNMLIGCNTNPPLIFRYDSEDGEPLPGIFVNLHVGAPDTMRTFAADKKGNLYVLEKSSTHWHVLPPGGDSLNSASYGAGKNNASDISVLGDGGTILVTDRTDNVVQAWRYTTTAGASFYWRGDNFLANATGLGKIYVAPNDHIYICQSRYGFISEYDRTGNVLGHIFDDQLNMVAPVAMALSPDMKTLYVIEVTGDGPGKIKRWVREK